MSSQRTDGGPTLVEVQQAIARFERAIIGRGVFGFQDRDECRAAASHLDALIRRLCHVVSPPGGTQETSR